MGMETASAWDPIFTNTLPWISLVTWPVRMRRRMTLLNLKYLSAMTIPVGGLSEVLLVGIFLGLHQMPWFALPSHPEIPSCGMFILLPGLKSTWEALAEKDLQDFPKSRQKFRYAETFVKLCPRTIQFLYRLRKMYHGARTPSLHLSSGKILTSMRFILATTCILWEMVGWFQSWARWHGNACKTGF